MTKVKLNVLLAKTDQLGAVAKKNIQDSIAQFRNKAGHFKGEQNIYKGRTPEFEDPKANVTRPVASTVKEWLTYTQRLSSEYLQVKIDQEATNCSGLAKADLTIDGENYGSFTTGELMALKGYFEATALKEMYEAMPTVSLTDTWVPSQNPENKQRGILESPIQKWIDKTTDSSQEVKWDPTGKQPGVIVNVKNTVEKADVSRQVFTGEISHLDRAAILERLTKIKVAIKGALETANGVESVKSNLNADKLLSYLNG